MNLWYVEVLPYWDLLHILHKNVKGKDRYSKVYDKNLWPRFWDPRWFQMSFWNIW
jgi:hypothetical protein